MEPSATTSSGGNTEHGADDSGEDGYSLIRDGHAPMPGISHASHSDSTDLTSLLLKLLNPERDSAVSMASSSLFANISDMNLTSLFLNTNIKEEQVVALVLGIIGVLANLSSLIAISMIRTSLTANLRLIVSLCASDMLVSGSVLMKVTHEVVSDPFRPDQCLELLLRGLLMTSHTISLLNLVGLALDHYFAILKPLNYPTLMCRKHANIMIIVFWIVSFLCGFSDFIIPSQMFSYCSSEPKNYCEVVWCTMYTEEYIVFGMAFVSILLMFILYATIFIQIRRYQSFQQQYRQNMKRNRRGLVTTIVIVFTFMVTWLPYCLFEVSVVIISKRYPEKIIEYLSLTKTYDSYLYNILLLNSLFDPIIYAMRMGEVQKGYRNIFAPCRKRRRRFGHGQPFDRRFGSSHASMSTSIYNRTSQSESYL